MDPKTKHARKPASAQVAAGSDFNRRLSALVMLLEEKGLLQSGEFEDAIMSLKVQFADQKPGGSRGAGIEERKGSEYRGPERRTEPVGARNQGQERRVNGLAPFGHVSGHTVNGEDGQPVSGVQLILRRGQGDARPIQFRSTKSDKQGRFVFLNLPIARSESGEAYAYDLEVRYRNQTLVANLPIRLNEGGHRVPSDPPETGARAYGMNGPQRFRRSLDPLLPPDCRGLAVMLSGGPDSTLLALLAVREARRRSLPC